MQHQCLNSRPGSVVEVEMLQLLVDPSTGVLHYQVVVLVPQIPLQVFCCSSSTDSYIAPSVFVVLALYNLSERPTIVLDVVSYDGLHLLSIGYCTVFSGVYSRQDNRCLP